MLIIFGFKMIKLTEGVCVKGCLKKLKKSLHSWRFQIADLVKILVPVSLLCGKLGSQVQGGLLALHYFGLQQVANQYQVSHISYVR